MTLDRFKPAFYRAMDPFVAASDRLGATPDAVSAAAFLVAVGAGLAFWRGGTAPVWYLVGSGLVLLNGVLDVLDGALAREQGVESRAGDLLDHVLDRYADVAIVAGVAAGVENFALGLAAVTGVLLTSYLGTQVEAVGLDREYGGLLGRADRLALTGVAGVAAFLVPRPVGGFTPAGWLLVVFAVVGHLTALQRFRGAWRDLSG